MFERPHHQSIATLLSSFNTNILIESASFFAGGTAITLLLDEYRESVDIDFICSSKEGYRLLRNTISHDLGDLLTTSIKHTREVRADRYGIRTFLEIDNTPIKFEIIFEDRIQVRGEMNSVLGVPLLSKQDMFCEKLLANTDRGTDRSTMSRDIIDLAMMIYHWGTIPEDTWLKAYSVYGKQLIKQFHHAAEQVNEKSYLNSCLDKLSMDRSLIKQIINSLNEEKTKLNKIFTTE